jgi:hypothetical protein
MPYKDPLKQKAAQRAWYERNKEELHQKNLSKKTKIRQFIEQYKKENSLCKDCGISYPPHILDFDHIRDKRFGITQASRDNISMTKILEEIAKCEIVCSNCHRHRTYMRSKNKTL